MAVDLTFRNAATLIEQALFNTLNLGLRRRLPAVADVATLRGVATKGASGSFARSDFDLVYVTAAGVCYQWSTASTAADDGNTVIAPSDATGNGRWLKTTSTVQTGYVVALRVYEGEQTEEELLNRLLGQRPAVVIRWESASHEPKSGQPGALYRYETNFDVWAVSSNYRGGAQPAALMGSPIAAEAAVDPGVNAMIGDIKSVLAGASGDELGQPGIAYCEIGDESVVYRSLSERLFVSSIGIRVHATVTKGDTGDVTIGSLATYGQIDGDGSQPFGGNPDVLT